MSKRAPRGQIIELGGEPRINFLPGEIQERKDARRRRRSLFLLVILVGILCGIGYVYSAQYAVERQGALEAEQQTTLDLLSQQAQFVEARNLANQVTAVGKGITHLTRNEVKWRELIIAMRDELPAGVQLRQWSFTGPTSQTVPATSAGIFPVEVGGLVSLDLIADSLSSIGAAVEAVSDMPGVLSVTVSSTSLLDEGQGYGTVMSVIVSTDVYEARFGDGWKPGMTPIPEPSPPPSIPEPDEQSDTTENSDNNEEGEQ